MDGLKYQGTGTRPMGASQAPWKSRPDLYRPQPDLVSAVNVALLLGKPLLVTGESGTGKTDLAKAVAWELGLESPLQFDTRSTSEARHLFYTYDALGRFQAAHSSVAAGVVTDADPRLFLRFQALGRAILRSYDEGHWDGFPSDDLSPTAVRSVVLVDEVDKAPRDFPNDLLGAIEQMAFSIPELQGARLTANTALMPIVIATSNSENVLPEPFLRRCIYHHIELPGPELLRQIVTGRASEEIGELLKREIDPKLVDRALALFHALRDARLSKPPATAELIDWVITLHARADTAGGAMPPAAITETLGVIIKRNEDRGEAVDAMRRALNGGATG